MSPIIVNRKLAARQDSQLGYRWKISPTSHWLEPFTLWAWCCGLAVWLSLQQHSMVFASCQIFAGKALKEPGFKYKDRFIERVPAEMAMVGVLVAKQNSLGKVDI